MLTTAWQELQKVKAPNKLPLNSTIMEDTQALLLRLPGVIREESLGSSSGLCVLIPQSCAQEGVLHGWCWIFLGPTSPRRHIWSLPFTLPSLSPALAVVLFHFVQRENAYLDSSWQTVEHEVYGMGPGRQWVTKPLVPKLGASMEDEDTKTSSTPGVPSAVLTLFQIVPLGLCSKDGRSDRSRSVEGYLARLRGRTVSEASAPNISIHNMTTQVRAVILLTQGLFLSHASVSLYISSAG